MSNTRPTAPNRDELIRKVAEYFVSYIGAGASIEPFIDDFTPDLNVKNLQELLGYYFLLTGEVGSPSQTSRSEIALSDSIIGDMYGTPIGVLDFTSLLETRLQSLDPKIQHTTEIFRGEAPGKINWNQTVKYRYSSGNSNSQAFVCQVQEPSLNSSRNRVLVELLTQIEAIFTQFDDQVSNGNSVEWFEPWLRSQDRPEPTTTSCEELDQPAESPNLRAVIKTALNQTQLSTFDRQSVKVSDEEIRQVQRNRTPLYREAAELLAMYRRLKQGEFDEDVARSFLGSQVIQPPDDTETIATLFEMYWIFQLMDTFDDAERKLFTMAEDEDLIGQWRENGSTYLLFNDWDGNYDGKEYLSFELPSTGNLTMATDSTDEEADRFTSVSTQHDVNRRLGSILANKYLIERRVLGHTPTEKTPDIVLLRCERTKANPVIESAFIGEVKHSTNAQYLRKGTQQLLEYGAFARVGDDAELAGEHNGPYLAPDSSVVNSSNLELGYFVGHKDSLSTDDPVNIQVRGFSQSPNVVLQD